MVCPECDGKLDGRGENYTCSQCDTQWQVHFTCEACKNAPTVMSSCGTESFFCETCNMLKSRETMDKAFTKPDDA